MDLIPCSTASCRVSPSVLTECGSLNQGGSGKPIFLKCWDTVKEAHCPLPLRGWQAGPWLSPSWHGFTLLAAPK